MLEITLFFFQDCVILTFWNDVVVEFNKSLLIKLLREVHTYNFVDSIDINEDETNHLTQKFLQYQTPSGLLLSRLNLKVRTSIIFPCNLYPALGEYNRTQIIIT